MVRSLPRGIDRLPSGSYRARLTREGRQRTVGTFRTLEAAEAAYRQALGAVNDTSGRTPQSQTAWIRTTSARLRLVNDSDDRELITAVLDVLERRAARLLTARRKDKHDD